MSISARPGPFFPFLPLVLGVLALTGCEDPSTSQVHEQTSDTYEIKAAMVAWADDLEHGRIQSLLGRMAPDFLHQGDDLSRVEDWSRYWLSVTGRLRVLLDRMDVAVEWSESRAPDGTITQVSYTLQIQRCAETGLDCVTLFQHRALPGAEISWLSHFQKVDGVWMPVGDQKRFGLKLTSRHEGGMVLLGAEVRDPGQALRGGRVHGHGIESEVDLVLDESGVWTLGQEVVIAATPMGIPTFPQSYRLRLLTDHGEVEEIAMVHGMVQEFATLLAPAGEVSRPVSFFWEVPADHMRRFQVRVFEGEAPLLWVSQVIYGKESVYRGPALAAGTTYTYDLLVLDSWDDCSVNSGSFVPLAEGVLTPVVSQVSQEAGPVQGGQELTIVGAGFQPGLRVMFGVHESLRAEVVQPAVIECETPLAEPGVVNLLVINPSGRVGLLERAYTFE